MSSTSSMNPLFIRSAVSAGVAGLLDRFVCGEENLMQNVYFGVANGAGSAVGSYISSLTPAMLPDSTTGLYTGKGVMDRSMEILGSTAGSFILSKYMTEGKSCSMTMKILVSVASNFIGEYSADFVSNQPLLYLS